MCSSQQQCNIITIVVFNGIHKPSRNVHSRWWWNYIASDPCFDKSRGSSLSCDNICAILVVEYTTAWYFPISNRAGISCQIVCNNVPCNSCLRHDNGSILKDTVRCCRSVRVCVTSPETDRCCKCAVPSHTCQNVGITSDLDSSRCYKTTVNGRICIVIGGCTFPMCCAEGRAGCLGCFATKQYGSIRPQITNIISIGSHGFNYKMPFLAVCCRVVRIFRRLSPIGSIICACQSGCDALHQVACRTLGPKVTIFVRCERLGRENSSFTVCCVLGLWCC